MSLIGTLDIALRGDTGNLDKALDKSSKKVGDFAKTGGGGSAAGGAGALAGPWGMLGEAAATGALAVGAACIAVGAAIGAMAVSGMHSIDNLARTASTIGITQSALAGLQHGAALAGVGTEELNHGLQHFQRFLGEATQGSAEANQALARLGLSARDLTDVPLEQAAAQWYTAIGQLETQGERMALQQAAWGRGSQQLLETFRGGAGDMAAMTAEAQRLGLAVGPEGTAQVQGATRSWRQFEQAIEGICRSLGVIFAPIVTQVMEVINNFTGDVASGLSSNIKFFQELISVGFDLAKTYFEVMYTINGVIPLFNLIKDALGSQGNSWEDWRNIILRAAWSIQFYIQNWKDIVGLSFDQIGLWLTRLGNNFVHVFTTVIPRAVEALGDALNDIRNGRFEGIGDRIAGRLRDAMHRDETDLERRLGRDIQDRQGRLRGNLDDFLRQRMDEFMRQGRREEQPGRGEGLGNIVAKKPAAMEAGSKEAFSVIYGTQDRQQRALNVANDQLRQLRQAVEELRQIRRQRAAMRRARL